MAEILKLADAGEATVLISTLMMLISTCAIILSIVVEGLKSISVIERLPTKLVVYVTSVILTPLIFIAVMAYLKQPIEWYMVFGAFLAAFVVAKVSMNGWDDIKELKDRLFKK